MTLVLDLCCGQSALNSTGSLSAQIMCPFYLQLLYFPMMMNNLLDVTCF
uniref:Uncharacterized protein n=1 Tax=Rhizophora mucronata TaxID=61149 RepID=A0A2P2N013_RHIMU